MQQGFPQAGEPWFGGSAQQIFELHWSIVLTVVMLFGPKVMGTALILLDPAERRAFGGAASLSAGFVAEFVMSALLAPVRMLTACRAVVEVVCGIDTGWNAQRRVASETTLAEAWSAYRVPTVVGLALLLIAAPFSDLVIWMAPIIVGLVCSAPIAIATSSVRAGSLARRLGVFVTPEEIAPPAGMQAPLSEDVAPQETASPTYA